MKKYFKIFIFAFIVLEVVLLFGGKRILVHETRGGYVEGYGETKKNMLVCKYFTGRSFVTTVFHWSPNNMMGRDSCPFWISPQDWIRGSNIGKKIEGLISPDELLRKLANVEVGEKIILNIETEMSEDLRQGVIRGLRDINISRDGV